MLRAPKPARKDPKETAKIIAASRVSDIGSRTIDQVALDAPTFSEDLGYPRGLSLKISTRKHIVSEAFSHLKKRPTLQF
jgi:hypothetical protein